MNHRNLAAVLLLFVLACVNSGVAAEKDGDTKSGKGSKARQAEAIFENIKSLSGEWVHAKGPVKGTVGLSVRVIAGGSAVVERQFPGTPMEMITVYHLDGDEVMLNHYCVLGNQPRLKAAVGDRKNTIKFSFVGATNLTSKNDPHMHEGWLTFVSKDSIKSSWTKFVDGKAAEEHSFELTRKKKQDKTRKDR